MSVIPPYDIFRGHPNKDPMWVEALEDSAAAKKRMQYHAMQNPGPYFIFCHKTREVVASIDTSITGPARE
jgi:hypothetical protein